MKLNQPKQKILYFSLGILILFSGIFAVNSLLPSVRHTQDDIEITIGAQATKLQDAIGAGSLSEGTGTYCSGKNCGPNPCGGYCGPYYDTCPVGQVCSSSGNCVTPCVPATSCTGLCGTQNDGCGGTYECGACTISCGTLQPGYVCDSGCAFIKEIDGDYYNSAARAEAWCETQTSGDCCYWQNQYNNWGAMVFDCPTSQKVDWYGGTVQNAAGCS